MTAIGGTPSGQPGVLPAGSIFQDGYEILAELGSGSFGRVYKARQRSTGQAVAIKVLRFWGDDGPADVTNQSERFRREMRLSAGLSHPNIVRLFDSGETEDGRLFAVFEYVPGSTLKEVLAREGSLGWGETVHLMTQVLDALSCAHARGVVHRDLKPENIMVTKTGARRNALVLDFGLGGLSRDARDWTLPRLTATCELMGTPCYAAPEQLRGETTSPRSDLYSWGLIFLECLTGAMAIGGGSVHEIILKQLAPDPVPIPACVRDRRLRRLLQTVTAKQAERRDVSIAALFQALGAIEPEPPAATLEERAPEGERRQLTVVSCGLTVTATDAAPPDLEELDQLLHAQHALCARLAARSGGVAAAVGGGSVLLAFGYPQAREDDARRASHAALRIAGEVERASARLAAERRLRLEVRIGIHTGLVIAHEPRPGLHGEALDLVGVTPQVATRLQELAQPGEILASQDTQRLIRGALSVEPAGEHRLPELSRALPVFRVTGELRPRAGLDSIPLVRETPLVGRRQQLAQLLDAWRRMQAGRGGAVLVTGEPGIGKSRLVRELRRRVPADVWFEARCVAEQQDSPLRPIADMIAAIGEPLESMLRRRGLDPAETLPPLAAALSLPLDPRWPRPQLTPEREKELAFDILLRLLVRRAADRPVVMAFEDVHWADPTTLELLSLIVREVGSGDLVGADAPRILLVATARPEFTSPWPVGEVAPIPLGRLERDEVEAMVNAGLASGRPLPRAVIAEVIRRTDGVPLFVEEVTRVLMESGVATGAADGAVLDVASLDIPGTLRDLLSARLDALSPTGRATAQLAAVLGREFRGDMLRAAATEDEAILREDLRELLDAGIVYHRRSAPSESYVFRHALVREAAYESMIRSARQRLHLRVATTLRERFPEVERNQPDILALHFEHGGDLDTAVAYWNRAGDRTMVRGAYVEAIRLFERGLALLERLPESRQRTQHELGFTESLGTALLLTRGFGAPEVEEKFTHALRLCEVLGGEDVPLRVLAGVWNVQIARSDRQATAILVENMRQRAERFRDPVTMLSLHGWAGVRAFYLGDFVEARDEMTKATEWYHTEGYRSFVEQYGYDGGILVYAILAWTLWILGYPERARDTCDAMLAIAERTANPGALAAALAYAANLARARRELGRVPELTARCLALSTSWLGAALCTQGWAAVQQGDVEAGIARMKKGLTFFERAGVHGTYDYHRSALIEAHLTRGATDEALPIVRDALARCQTLLDCFHQAELHRLEGELLRRRGDEAGAETAFRAALDLAGRQSARSYELRAAMSWARLLRDQGKRDAARDLLAPVYDWFTEGHDTHDVREAAALLAELR